jgi:hypothetical protein
VVHYPDGSMYVGHFPVPDNSTPGRREDCVRRIRRTRSKSKDLQEPLCVKRRARLIRHENERRPTGNGRMG